MDKAIGIINANYDTPDLKELINGRTAASVPFGGRYRMIDFALSNMVNADITSVGIITPYKYRSLLDHVGAGSEWNLDRKNGGLFVLPGSVFGISSPGARFLLRDFRRNMVFLSRAQAQYVVITTANVIANMDYSALIEQHEKSGADVTMATITATEADKDLMGVELEAGKVPTACFSRYLSGIPLLITSISLRCSPAITTRWTSAHTRSPATFTASIPLRTTLSAIWTFSIPA